MDRLATKPSAIIRPQTLRTPFRRLQSTTTVTTTTTTTVQKPKGLKALTKAYGMAALGVYLGLSAIDLPICYVVVHSMGSEKIEHYQNQIKVYFGYGQGEEEFAQSQLEKRIQRENEEGLNKDKNGGGNDVWKYIKSQFSWTEFAIAYGIHKSFIFIRLPITAAITPGVVAILRRWGFNIGPKTVVNTVSTNLTKNAKIDVTASSQKFGTRPSGKKKWWWFF